MKNTERAGEKVNQAPGAIKTEMSLQELDALLAGEMTTIQEEFDASPIIRWLWAPGRSQPSRKSLIR